MGKAEQRITKLLDEISKEWYGLAYDSLSNQKQLTKSLEVTHKALNILSIKELEVKEAKELVKVYIVIMDIRVGGSRLLCECLENEEFRISAAIKGSNITKLQGLIAGRLELDKRAFNVYPITDYMDMFNNTDSLNSEIDIMNQYFTYVRVIFEK